MAKKTGRITVALQCKACKSTNYQTSVHKDNKPESLKKHCNHADCKKHMPHKIKEKLK